MATNERPKLKELMLYVAWRFRDVERFGLTKLYKILFFADFAAFRDHEKKITEAVYVKAPRGPMPDGAAAVIRELVDAGDAEVRVLAPGSYEEQRLTPLRDLDVSLFTPEELRRVDELCDRFHDASALDLSDLSHEFVGWNAAPMGGRIREESVFVSFPSPSPEDEQHAREIVAASAAARG